MSMKKFRLLVVLFVIGLFMISCSDDDGGTAGGSGIATVDPNSNQPAPAPAATAETAAATAASQGAPAATGSNNFSLLFLQDVQPCASCGIWFDSAELVVNYTGSNKPYTFRQNGNLLIKQSSGKQGRFQTSLASIPAGSAITKATLYMRLNSHEGIAGSDNSSVISVYDFSGGSRGPLVRKITASGDIKGAGYSKSNPNVPIDFTAYAKQVHGQ